MSVQPVKIRQTQIGPTLQALARLAANDLPVMTKARINRLLRATRDVVGPFEDAIRPLIQQYTTDEENPTGLSSIDPGHPRFEEFSADPQVGELLAEELVVEDVRPLLLSELDAAERRLDRRSPPVALDLPSPYLRLLTDLGFIREDDSGKGPDG